MNNISEIVRRVIEDFINEELSISDDVSNYVEAVSNEVIENNRNGKFTSFNKVIGDGSITARYVEKWFYVEQKLNGTAIPCRVLILDFETMELNNMFATRVSGWNDNMFDEDKLEIMAVIDGVGGVLNLQLLKHILSHEAEHAYQYLMKFNGDLVTKKSVYHKASLITKGKDNVHTSDEYKIVGHLLYYYHHTEMDANVNGLYSELMVGLDFDDTIFKNELDASHEMTRKFIEEYTPQKYDNILKYFGLDFKRFVNFLYKQNRYLNKKVKRVVKLVNRRRDGIYEMTVKKPTKGLYVK